MRILIATATAGAGHVQAAAALEEAWRMCRPQDIVKRVDVLDYTPAPYRQTYSQGYVKLVIHAPKMWSVLFKQADNPKLLQKLVRVRRTLSFLPARKFAAFVQRFQPDAVLCTHFLPIEVIGHLKTRKRGALTTLLVSVVTDFDVHALWMEPTVNLYCVAAHDTKARLADRGVPAEQVAVTGIPVSARYASHPDMVSGRRQLDLGDGEPTVLVLSGGFGIGPVKAIVHGLEQTGRPLQIVVVCGKNKDLERDLKAAGYRHPTRVFGFVTNMHELMAISDVIVTKPGGMTVSEALALGKPLVIVNPIPGQETANAEFLCRNNAAIMPDRIEDLPVVLERLLGSKQLEDMARHAKALGKPEAAWAVCRHVASFLTANAGLTVS